jgi:TP901 family phage tail tape measure protein
MAFAGAGTADLAFILKMRDEATAVLRRHQQALASTGQAANQAGAGFNRAGQSIRGFTGNAAAATSSIGAMGQAIGQLIGSITAAITTVSGFTKAVRDFGELEQGMIGVAKTTGMSAGEITKMTEDLVQMSMRLPSTTGELTELAQAAGQVGVNGAENILAYTETLAKLGSASNLAGEDAAGMLATIQILTKTPFSEVKNMASAIVQLGNDSRATERQIADMAAEVAKGTANYKLSAQEVLGLSTSFVELAVTPELAKSTVQRLYGSLSQATKEGGENLRMLGEMTGMTKKQFTELFRSDPTQAVLKFAEAYGKMNSAQKNTSPLMKAFKLDQLELLGVLDPVSLNLDMVNKRIKQSTDAWKDNVALDKEADAALTGLLTQLKLTGNAVTAVSQTVGAEFAPVLKDIAVRVREALQAFRDWFRSLDEGQRQILAWGALATGVLTSVGLAFAAIVPLLPVIAAGIAAIAAAMVTVFPYVAVIGGLAAAYVLLTRETKAAIPIQEEFKQQQDRMKGITQELIGASDDRAAALKRERDQLISNAEAVVKLQQAEIARQRAVWAMQDQTGVPQDLLARQIRENELNAEEAAGNAQLSQLRIIRDDTREDMGGTSGTGRPKTKPGAKPGGDVPEVTLADKDGAAKAKNNLKEILEAARAAQAQLALFNRTGSEAALANAQDMEKAKEALLSYAESAKLGTTDLAAISAKAGISQEQLATAFRLTREAAEGMDFKRYTMDAERHITATNKLAEATLKGARAVREQNIQNEIADELDAKKIKPGTPQAEMVEANIRSKYAANDNLSAAEALQAQREKLGLSKEELGLTGETEEKRALALQHLTDANELNRIGVGWTEKERTEWLKNADALAANQQAIAKHNADLQAFREAWVESGRVIGNALGDALMGTESWGDALKKIPSQLASIAYQLLVMKPLEQAMTGFDFWGMASKGAQFALGAWGSGGTGVDMTTHATAPVIGVESMMLPSAKGNVFPFAKGGGFTNSIVDRETFFRFAKGSGFANGVMGEAGPEAVVPLRRMSDGNLGVATAGGGGVTINAPVTVNISGGGGSPAANADLGKIVGAQVAGELRAMVVDELRKQMRPGGVMY